MTASWLEKFGEARFKQVNGDFVFRAPGMVAHHYLVSAAQKTEIQRLLAARPRAFDRKTLLVIAVIAAFIGFNDWLEYMHAGFWSGFLGVFVLIGVASVAGWYADFKRIGPALVGARYTEQRISWREQTETLVRLSPLSSAIVCGVAAALVAVAGALVLLNVPGDSGFGRIFWRTPSSLGFWWGMTVLCAFGAGYCFYLAALRLLRSQRPQAAGAGQS